MYLDKSISLYLTLAFWGWRGVTGVLFEDIYLNALALSKENGYAIFLIWKWVW